MGIADWRVGNAVKDTLSDSDLMKMKPFSFMGIGFDPKTFKVLKTVIEQGKIKVEYDSTKDGYAEYDYATNTMLLGFYVAGTFERTALIVHESVHAVYDVAKQKMSNAISEAIAYIVQCQYVYVANGPGKRLSSPIAKKDSVFKYAWSIAAAIQEGKEIDKLDKTNLLSSISAHPYYAKIATGQVPTDGVPGT
ncbi:MAG: hypothetical protein AAB336_13840 [Acidobacteriota bacterium]